MKITKLEIENLRAVQSVSLTTAKMLNVIVGPNATGKTTVLEAIRLAKSLLSPRYFQETEHVLLSLGAIAQHVQAIGDRSFDYSALANDLTLPIDIKAVIELSAEDAAKLQSNQRALSMLLLQSRLARNEDSSFGLTQYLSTPEGTAALASAEADVAGLAQKYVVGHKLTLSLNMTADSPGPRGGDFMSQTALAVLDRALPPARTIMSYFPADRAFPQGEVVIQIGSADMQQQLHSHMGQPSTKYSRLKTWIAHGVVTGLFQGNDLAHEFSIIFEHFLPGKSFVGVSVNAIGLLKVLVRDEASGKQFDIDSMSSGEKGLILTFMLLRHSVEPGGVVLLDEPELHLNPAVSKNIVPFIIKYCCEEKNIQAFVCTHSPEILTAAFERDDCELFHLRSGRDLTPVYPKDVSEVLEILKRLGASTEDVLFSKGSIFVEGDADADILAAGFDDVVGGFKITQLGGRQEVEKSIRNLQSANKSAPSAKPAVFIMDMDRDITDLKSGNNVSVIQWERYSIENYLLDQKVMFDVLKETSADQPESRGSFWNEIRELALAQVEELAMKKSYAEREPDNAGMRGADVKGRSVQDVANIMAERISLVKSKVDGFDTNIWKADFIDDVTRRAEEIRSEWQNSWHVNADGKKIIDSLYERYKIRVDKLTFKKRIILGMREDNTETWRAIKSLLEQALQKTQSNA